MMGDIDMALKVIATATDMTRWIMRQRTFCMKYIQTQKLLTKTIL